MINNYATFTISKKYIPINVITVTNNFESKLVDTRYFFALFQTSLLWFNLNITQFAINYDDDFHHILYNHA